MSQHPNHETLAEFAWDALEGAEADAVETHVAACGDCARLVERVRAEARRLSKALEVPVPDGLAARILDAASGSALASPERAERVEGSERSPSTPSLRSVAQDRDESKSGGRFAAWAGLAAAALFAVTSAWAWHERTSAVDRLNRIERELAALKAHPAENARPADDLEDILRSMARVEIEGEIGVAVGTVPSLSPEDAEKAKATLLACSDTMSEMLAKIANGKIDMDALQSTDTFAGLNNELSPGLEPDEFKALIASIERPSRADAEALAVALVGDLQVVAQLDRAQAVAIQKLVVDNTAWRRDFHFLPDVVKKDLACRLIGVGGTLKPEVESLLTAQQKNRVLSYLASSETERTKYWDNLKKNANKH